MPDLFNIMGYPQKLLNFSSVDRLVIKRIRENPPGNEMSHRLHAGIDLGQLARHGNVVGACGKHVVEDEEHARRFVRSATGRIEAQRRIQFVG